jgi:hypothetical protein
MLWPRGNNFARHEGMASKLRFYRQERYDTCALACLLANGPSRGWASRVGGPVDGCRQDGRRRSRHHRARTAGSSFWSEGGNPRSHASGYSEVAAAAPMVDCLSQSLSHRPGVFRACGYPARHITTLRYFRRPTPWPTTRLSQNVRGGKAISCELRCRVRAAADVESPNEPSANAAQSFTSSFTRSLGFGFSTSRRKARVPNAHMNIIRNRMIHMRVDS